MCLEHSGLLNREAYVKQQDHDILLKKATGRLLGRLCQSGISRHLTTLTFILHEPDREVIQEAVISIMSSSPEVVKLTVGMTPNSERSYRRSLSKGDILIFAMKDALLKMEKLRVLFINLLIKPRANEVLLQAIAGKKDLLVLALNIETLGPTATVQPPTVVMENVQLLVADMRGRISSREGRHPLSIFKVDFPRLRTLVLGLPHYNKRKSIPRVLRSANRLIVRSGASSLVLVDEVLEDWDDTIEEPDWEGSDEEDSHYCLELPPSVSQVAIPSYFSLNNPAGEHHFPGVSKLALICNMPAKSLDMRDSVGRFVSDIEGRIRTCNRTAFPGLKEVQLLGFSLELIDDPVDWSFKDLVCLWLLAHRLQTVEVALTTEAGVFNLDFPPQIILRQGRG